MLGPQTLTEALQRMGLNAVGRFYSPYRGRVTRVDDPEERGRIQVVVPRVSPASNNGTAAQLDVWVDPISVQAGPDRGFFWPPDLGDVVWVFFDEGRASRPVGYLGGWFGTSSSDNKLPSEFSYTKQGDNIVAPEKRGFVTRKGHALIFDDSDAGCSVKLIWRKPAAGDASATSRSTSANRASARTSYVEFGKDGQVVLHSADGAEVRLDKDKISATMGQSTVEMLKNGEVNVTSTGTLTLKAPRLLLDSPDISVGSGATSPLVKANEFAPQFNGHFHGTAVGPTTPPTIPLTPAVRTPGLKSR